MKNFTLLFALLLVTFAHLNAQRGGSHHNNNHNNGWNNNSSNGQQFNSMLNLNSGQNNGGLRPNGNVGNSNSGHGHNSGAGHGHGNGHGHNNGHGHTCSHGSACSFGCTHNQYVHTPVCMSAFDAWLHSLSHISNEAVRWNMAEDYVTHNWITSHQLYDILSLFSNQSVMMNVAQDAYGNLCDPYNFHRIYGLFSNNACVMTLQNCTRR